MAFVIYWNSPPDALHDSSGWEPETVVILELIGYFFYLLGIGVGAARIVLTAAFTAGRKDSEKKTT